MTQVLWSAFGKEGRNWERDSKDVVLLTLLSGIPGSDEMLVQEKRMKDPEDFAFVWEGTIQALAGEGLIVEIPKKRSMFRRFVLTPKGVETAKARWKVAKKMVLSKKST